jgi:hypothetical protein
MDDCALMQMASNALKNCRLLIYKWSDFAHDSLKKEEELASDIASLSLAIQSLDDRLAQPEPEAVDWEAVAADQAMTIAMMTLEPKREWVEIPYVSQHDSPVEYNIAEAVAWAVGYNQAIDSLKERNNG